MRRKKRGERDTIGHAVPTRCGGKTLSGCKEITGKRHITVNIESTRVRTGQGTWGQEGGRRIKKSEEREKQESDRPCSAEVRRRQKLCPYVAETR